MSLEGFTRRALVEAAKASGISLHEGTIRLVAVYSGGQFSFAVEVDAHFEREILFKISDHPEAAIRAALASLRAVSEEPAKQQGGIPVLGEDGSVAGVIEAKRGS